MNDLGRKQRAVKWGRVRLGIGGLILIVAAAVFGVLAPSEKLEPVLGALVVGVILVWIAVRDTDQVIASMLGLSTWNGDSDG